MTLGWLPVRILQFVYKSNMCSVLFDHAGSCRRQSAGFSRERSEIRRGSGGGLGSGSFPPPRFFEHPHSPGRPFSVYLFGTFIFATFGRPSPQSDRLFRIFIAFWAPTGICLGCLFHAFCMLLFSPEFR